MQKSKISPSNTPAWLEPGSVSRIASGEFSWRVLTLVAAYRGLILAVLLTIPLLIDPISKGFSRPLLFAYLCMGFLGLAFINFWTIWQRQPSLKIQAAWQLSQDIVCITLITYAAGGIFSNFANLLFVPIGALSLLLTRRFAILFASAAVISLLSMQVFRTLYENGNIAEFSSTGMTGLMILAAATLVQPIAKRMRETEALAVKRGIDLANLSELNEYIIQHLRESIIVIDANDRVRLINASAAQLFQTKGHPLGKPLATVAPKLHQVVAAWRENDEGQQASMPSLLVGDGAKEVTPHIAPLGREKPCAATIFLEDQTELASRMQQIKLAGLGRLSASIAHEIRNPMGAISYANQLLSESERLNSEDKRLIEIIQRHTERVSTIVKNVMQLSRRDDARPQDLELEPWLEEFCEEFRGRYTDSPISIVHEVESFTVSMDPSQLHQVLWNLCENATLYGRSEKGIQLTLGKFSSNRRPFLEVRDYGQGIPKQRADHIFEPFVTGSATGTGLGLFLARQLCEFNQATLIYEPADGGGSCFRIVFADPERWQRTGTDG